MSTKRSLFTLIAIALSLAWSNAVFGASDVDNTDKQQSSSLEEDGCGGESNLQIVQCINGYIGRMDIELNRVYQKALAQMPVKDEHDKRREREQLRKSQRAWLKYKSENCTLIGGQEGGSNLWVAHFAALCEEREIRARINFLQKIADGQGID